MRFVRLAMCVAACAVLGGLAYSEDIDVRSLQQKLAAQEARLNDLQAKVNSGAYASGSEVEGLVSINKNAVVTVGGQLNTRYFYHDIRGSDGDTINVADNTVLERGNDYDASLGDLRITDALLKVNVDVNENFDAFLQLNLQSSLDIGDNAEKYYVRWKNVCNSGFGLKVGRDVLTFGEATPIGALATYAAGSGDGAGAAVGDIIPSHANWDVGRYNQVTPYWESQDGKFGFEVSLYQDYSQHSRENADLDSGHYWKGGDHYRDRNYGFGSMSARFRARPIEGLLLSASVFNFRDNGTEKSRGFRPGASWGWDDDGNFIDVNNSGAYNAGDVRIANGRSKKNSTAIDLAFQYRPAAFNRLNVWGQWIHGWNVDNYDGYDSDAVNLGVSYDLNESWTIFAMGDYLQTKGMRGMSINPALYDDYDKAVAWAGYVGVKYVLPYGVSIEAGWKHEQIKFKNHAADTATVKHKDSKIKSDTLYAHLGFDF